MNERNGKVFDIQRFCVHDGPGIRTIVFIKGCPLRCQWCCNPESQRKYSEISYLPKKCIDCKKCINACQHSAIKDSEERKVFDVQVCKACKEKLCAKVCPAKAITVLGQDVTVEELMQEIQKDELFYKNSGGGVTVSGGEPLLQSDFCRELLAECKKKGYHTAIETSSYCKWEDFEKILEYTDLFLCDVKHMDDEKHVQYTGVSNKIIRENLLKLSERTKNIIIRVPVVPEFNANEAEIRAICEFTSRLGLKEIHLLPYHRLGRSKYDKLFLEYKLDDIEPPSKEYMKQIEDIVRDCGMEIQIGG